jgi:hypothetical protein
MAMLVLLLMRAAGSASGDGQEQCDLLMVGKAVVARDVLTPEHGQRRAQGGTQVRLGVAEAPVEILHGGTFGQVDREQRCCGQA